ncbi:MAG: DNA glycosylase AlkZ-like family protein, partial [Thermomicrobiales bacterium]
LDPGMLTKLDDLRSGRGKPVLTTLLSPFDSLVWHRGRNVDLFDFEYRIEVYTPEAKRTYGYYSLPILHRGRLIGRIDLHYARKAKLMTIRSAHLEPKVKANERIAAAIVGAVIDYMQFLGGGDLVLGTTANPPELGPLLAEAIRGDYRSVEAAFATEAETAIV